MSRIAVVGGHGKVARHLHPLLAAAGHRPVALVRREEYRAELEGKGAEVRLLDVEGEDAAGFAEAFEGCHAVVFAAGGGPNSGAARKETVDKGAAILLADAAEKAGVRRYVMVSSMGADAADPTSEDVFQVYLRAKKAADDDVRSRDLDWTVVRPGRLTDDAGTGRLTVGTLGRGQVPRADVAATLLGVLHTPSTVGATFDLLGGDTPVDEALASL